MIYEIVGKGVEMFNYKDVVTESNSGRVYECKLPNGVEIRLQVHENCDSEFRCGTIS